jgi:TetR/AcrR family transcriptional repressor of nem operon
MRESGRISPEAEPAELAVTVMTALQGGLLLAQTTRDVRPLELALDMAIAHVGLPRRLTRQVRCPLCRGAHGEASGPAA